MKLLSVPLARVVWSMNIDEINPRGKNVHLDLVPRLVDLFSFETYPRQGEDFSKEGMKFTGGTFKNASGDSLMVGFTVWTDGISVDTFSSTMACEEFMETVKELLPTLGYECDPGMVKRKAYNSQLYVSMSKQLTMLDPRLNEFANRITSLVGNATGNQANFGLSAIEFWPDQTQNYKPANFSLQKRTGDPLSGNRYWSQAPLPTDKHLQILEEFEAIIL